MVLCLAGMTLKKEFVFSVKKYYLNLTALNETLILWTAYYKYKFGVDARDIFPKLVFPYNSADEDNDNGWWDDYGDRVSPLTRKDILVGNQFWHFITDNENALQAIITAINNLSKDAEFKKLYSKVFELETEAESKDFSYCVKKYRIKETRNVDMSTNNGIVNGRRKLKWKHGDCGFEERFSKLLDPEKYICPTCGNIISYEE